MDDVQPKVAVILPVYNGATTILEAVESILNQDFTDFECIIINDGSTDETLNLLKGIHDKRVTILDQQHLGIAKALNAGLKATRSEFIVRMDADDWSYPNRLSCQLAYLKNNTTVDIVGCHVEFSGDIEAQQGYYLYCNWINQLESPSQIYLNRFVESPLAHPSVMIRRSVFDQYGFYNEGNVPEDYELWLRLLHHGIRMSKVSQILLKWTDHQERLSRNHSNYSFEAFYNIKSEFLAIWMNKKFDTLPEIWIWGTGKSVRQKSKFLSRYNLEISKYIDVVLPKKKTQDQSIVYYKNIPDPNPNLFILSYVSDRKGRLAIESFLLAKGYKHGLNFYLMA